jgi:GT2 family glycosyltransferase
LSAASPRAGAESVAVVIPSWNRLDDLRACVASVRAQAGVEVELLVVDNGSTDGTIGYLGREDVAHLALPSNAGFAHAVNLGVARTASRQLLVLNADAVLDRDCLARLSACLADDPTLGGAAPRILQLTGDRPEDSEDPQALVYSLGQALTRDGRAYEVGAGCRQGDLDVRRREIFGICGAACLLRRDLFSDLGGYDERYFAFYEDVDLNVRARIAGWRFALEPSAVAWHRGRTAWSAGFRRPAADNARLVARNRLATQIKFVPASAVPRGAAIELGALARAARERRLAATLAGKLAALRWLSGLIAERRQLRRSGDLQRARAWLGLPPAG